MVTAVTAQNTADVLGIHNLPAQFVDLQITAVLSDLPVAAVKTGMLATAEIVSAVARRAASGDLPRLVVDPVLVSSTGKPLLEEEAVESYLELLIPRAEVLTPNIREAAVLTRSRVEDVEDMIRAGEALCDLGARTVVVKGGHLPGQGAPDVVVESQPAEPSAGRPSCGPRTTTVLESERIDSKNDHGTGCSLSAAIAALLASGETLPDAIRQAKSYVANAIRGSSRWTLGRGHGPLDHFGWDSGELRRELGPGGLSSSSAET